MARDIPLTPQDSHILSAESGTGVLEQPCSRTQYKTPSEDACAETNSSRRMLRWLSTYFTLMTFASFLMEKYVNELFEGPTPSFTEFSTFHSLKKKENINLGLI